MKRTGFWAIALAVLSVLCIVILFSSGMKEGRKQQSVLIGKQFPNIVDARFSAETLWAMGRIGTLTIHPEIGALVYNVRYYSVRENKSNSELLLLKKDAKEPIQLTHSADSETDPVWLADGKLAYLKGGQVWIAKVSNKDLQDAFCLTPNESDIEGFSFSPDGLKLLFIKQVKTIPTTIDKYPDLDKATGRIVTDLMYKHWDEWTETAPHPFVADIQDNAITNVRDILEGQPFECPMKPFGGIEQLAWSNDCSKIAYTCRKKTGLDYAVSTNSDIYLYDLETGEETNLTEGMMGYDINPQFSPDGTKLAWLSMERDGYESDQNRLMVKDLTTGENSFVSRAFESSVDEFLWKDNDTLIFTGCWHALVGVYAVNLEGEMIQLAGGQYDYALCGLRNECIIVKRHSMQQADEIYEISEATNALDDHTELTTITQLTFENKHIYDQVEMGKVEPIWQKTVDGKEMLTWIIYPPQFDPEKKYPTLLYCEGGPQSPVSQFWSYRWNFMMMSAHDYIVVAPNRRGLPGFGIEWNEEISGDYGGLCMQDYLAAIDQFAAENEFVDKDHLGCVGASFGGFSVYWLAGHHDGRFKAFIAHDGIFNLEMQYLETEEKWFANWDLGGAYWEKDNEIAQRTYANSPHRFVDKWDTPILCIHGEKDYRILANQAMAAFDAAKMRGIEAELLIFPDENHWVLQPQNGVLWQRTFFEWLDKWLKE